MGNLLAGLSLILLAVIVVLAAVLHFSGDPFHDPAAHPLEADETGNPDDDASTVIVTVGSGRNVDPIPAPLPTLPQNLGEDPGPDYLSPEERALVDADGFLPHTVEKNETLSRIADKYLGRASLWHLLKEHNPDLANPKEIREGTVIKIPLWLRQPR